MSDGDQSEAVVKPEEPAVPPVQAPAGPDPFAQMVQQLEAELRSSETQRVEELKEAKDAGEDVSALAASHKREKRLEEEKLVMAKALIDRERLVQQAYVAEIDREIKAQAKEFDFDEAEVRRNFLKTRGMPEDLDRVVDRMLHKKRRETETRIEEEEPETYDSALVTSRSGSEPPKDLEERLKWALERDHRSNRR